MNCRAGIGFDSHHFIEGRKLFLGGIEVPHDRGLNGHSDADVLLHALTDAMLGAAGLGDIGTHFPDSNPRWKDSPSRLFVEFTLQMLQEKGYRVGNVDLTIFAQSPRMQPYRPQIRASIAAMLQIPDNAVNVKATTTDGMGFIGRNEGIAAQAIVLIESRYQSYTYNR